MDYANSIRCTAFEGERRIASGGLAEVALKSKVVVDTKSHPSILIFDDETSETIEIDFRGTDDDVLKRLGERADAGTPTGEEKRGPGRPKLGVVAREVTLLPRHWDWLNHQPGGASVALRKLVEEARVANRGKDRIRRAQEAAYRFMSVMAGNLAGFEEAARALFAGKQTHFDAQTEAWPTDIREHVRQLSADAFPRA